MSSRYAVDTNVLLRLVYRQHPLHSLVEGAVSKLALQGVELCFAPQNIGEFWNTATRPVERNGFGLSGLEAAEHVQSIERRMTLLPENESVYRAWRGLLLTHDVRGVQVHDAHIAAVLAVHGVAHILTFNGTDFQRFPHVVAVHPQQVN
jgi:predicted nucleic acid-binding protein